MRLLSPVLFALPVILFSSLCPCPEVSAGGQLRKVPVIWLLGQSHANGSTLGYWLANPLVPTNKWPQLAKQSKVHIWWPGKSTLRPQSRAAWESYRTGSINAADNNAAYYFVEGAFGPECSMMDAAAAFFNEDVFLFKVTGIGSLNSTSNFGRWSKGAAGFYEDTFAEWKRASLALMNQGMIPDVKAVVWVQGEMDANSPQTYELLLKGLITDLRADIQASVPRKYRRKVQKSYPMPVVIGALHENHQPSTIYDPIEKTIRAAQLKVANDDPFAWVCPVKGLVTAPFGHHFHFEPPSDVMHGYRLFDTLKNGMGDRLH